MSLSLPSRGLLPASETSGRHCVRYKTVNTGTGSGPKLSYLGEMMGWCVGKTIPSPGLINLIACCLWPTWKHLLLYDQPTKLRPLFTHACHLILPICPAEIDLLNLSTRSRGTLKVYLVFLLGKEQHSRCQLRIVPFYLFSLT